MHRVQFFFSLCVTPHMEVVKPAGGKALEVVFDFGGAALFGVKGAGFDFLLGSLRSVPQPSSHSLTKLQNSRQLLPCTPLPRLTFERINL